MARCCGERSSRSSSDTLMLSGTRLLPPCHRRVCMTSCETRHDLPGKV